MSSLYVLIVSLTPIPACGPLPWHCGNLGRLSCAKLSIGNDNGIVISYEKYEIRTKTSRVTAV